MGVAVVSSADAVPPGREAFPKSRKSRQANRITKLDITRILWLCGSLRNLVGCQENWRCVVSRFVFYIPHRQGPAAGEHIEGWCVTQERACLLRKLSGIQFTANEHRQLPLDIDDLVEVQVPAGRDWTGDIQGITIVEEPNHVGGHFRFHYFFHLLKIQLSLRERCKNFSPYEKVYT